MLAVTPTSLGPMFYKANHKRCSPGSPDDFSDEALSLLGVFEKVRFCVIIWMFPKIVGFPPNHPF